MRRRASYRTQARRWTSRRALMQWCASHRMPTQRWTSYRALMCRCASYRAQAQRRASYRALIQRGASYQTPTQRRASYQALPRLPGAAPMAAQRPPARPAWPAQTRRAAHRYSPAAARAPRQPCRTANSAGWLAVLRQHLAGCLDRRADARLIAMDEAEVHRGCRHHHRDHSRGRSAQPLIDAGRPNGFFDRIVALDHCARRRAPDPADRHAGNERRLTLIQRNGQTRRSRGACAQRIGGVRAARSTRQ